MSLFVMSWVLVMSVVSLIGILTHRSLTSSVSILCLLLLLSFISSFVRVFELMVTYLLSECRWLLKNVFSFLAVLYARAFLLLITGLMGMLGLCNFSRAFSVGGDGILWGRCLICFLLKILSHCCSAFWIVLWYLLVGSFGMVWKLFSQGNVWTSLV